MPDLFLLMCLFLSSLKREDLRVLNLQHIQGPKDLHGPSEFALCRSLISDCEPCLCTHKHWAFDVRKQTNLKE